MYIALRKCAIFEVNVDSLVGSYIDFGFHSQTLIYNIPLLLYGGITGEGQMKTSQDYCLIEI